MPNRHPLYSDSGRVTLPPMALTSLSRRPFVLLIALIPALGSAQWINYPTPGVPLTADGKPKLTAPTPKTRYGKPDLSGIWEPVKNNPCPPGGCNDSMPVPKEFINFGFSLQGGLPYQPWAADVTKKRTADLRKDDPISHCLPPGILRDHNMPNFRKIIQGPDQIAILHEFNAGFRQILTDGRPLPVDPTPSWNGYSVGRWVGDTLQVESIGFRDGLWIDSSGSPLTEAAKVTERFRRLNYGNLAIEVTVDDPRAYTKPWTVTLHQTIVPNTELLDYICLEDEQDIKHIDKADNR